MDGVFFGLVIVFFTRYYQNLRYKSKLIYRFYIYRLGMVRMRTSSYNEIHHNYIGGDNITFAWLFSVDSN